MFKVRRICAFILALICVVILISCAKSATKNPQISPFEITAIQRKEAKNNEAGYYSIDAGRGNPNWINKTVRYAFTSFMNYAINESELTLNYNSIAGQASKEGIAERFDTYYKHRNDPEDVLIKASIEYCVK